MEKRLHILFFLVCLLPTVAIVGIYFNSKDLLARQTKEHLSAISQIQENRLVNYLDKNLEKIKEFSSQLQLRLETNEFNQTGSKTSQTKMNDILLAALASSPNIKEISVLNPQGIIIGSTDNKKLLQDHSKDEVFIKGKKNFDETIFFKEPIAATHTGSNISHYITGPLILNDKFIGVISIKVTADELFTLFKDYTGLGKTGSWGLAEKLPDGNGRIIVPGRYDQDIESPIKSIVAKDKIHLPIIKALAGEEKIFEAVNYIGKPVIASTRHIDRVNWGLGVTVEQNEVYAPIGALRTIMVYSLVSTLILGFLAAKFSSWSINKSITKNKKS